MSGASYDIAVVGSGFGGSLMAMIARRLGHSVLLLESGSHPRTVIGESSTPLSNLLLGTIAEKYDLPELRPLTKWGTWQHSYPQVACGLKRGFSFFHHRLDCDPIYNPDSQMLVAASPHDRIADTHWYRADFDHLLVRQAQHLGVEYLDHAQITTLSRQPDQWVLQGTRHDDPVQFRAKLIIDATGPRGFLHRTLGIPEAAFPSLPATETLYSHFTGVRTFAETAPLENRVLPYPVDAAAVHHVFEGGWIWLLRFNNGVTSAGVAARPEIAARFRFSEGESAWERLLGSLPAVRRQFEEARPMMRFTHAPALHFRSAQIAGEGWVMLPSAAGFVDPLLSTGFPLTLLGVLELGDILKRDWKAPAFSAELQRYAQTTDANLLATARLVAALYANMHHFDTFRILSLLYFAGAAYAETVRRIGHPELASTFLLHGNASFGPASQALLERAKDPMTPNQRTALHNDVYALIEGIDVAGLCSRPSNHCYPVRPDDLLLNAHKVGATQAQIHEMLQRSDFYESVNM